MNDAPPPPNRANPATAALLAGFADELPALQAVAALADHYDDVTRQALAEVERRLGPPPVPYAWLALGSHARREPGLGSDQDSALVLGELPPGASEQERAAVAAYATALAEHAVDALTRAGMRPCDGGYMATTWAYSHAEWRTLLRRRIADPTPQAVLDLDVLLDMRQVGGTLDASDLARLVVDSAAYGPLLHGMAVSAVQFPSAIGAFGRIKTEDGRLDVKKGGLAPITLVARAYALVSRSTEVGTRERLAAAEQAELLSPRAVGRLGFAHALLTRLRLQHQLRQAKAGDALDDRVPLTTIAWPDRRMLRNALESIKEVQQATELRFHTHVQ